MRKKKKVNSGWSILIVELQKVALNKHLSKYVHSAKINTIFCWEILSGSKWKTAAVF